MGAILSGAGDVFLFGILAGAAATRCLAAFRLRLGGGGAL